MNKNLKKYGLIALVVILAGIGIFYAVRFYTTVKKEVKPALSAIPNDSMMLLRINNTVDFAKYLEHQHSSILGLLNLDAKSFTTSTVKALSVFENHIKEGELWISSHERNEKVSYLLLFNVDALKQRSFERMVGTMHASSSTTAFDMSGMPVFTAFSEGVFIASPDSNLMQEALNQIQEPSNLLQDVALEKVLNAAGKNSPANLFLHIPELTKMLEKTVRSEYAPMLKMMGVFSQWIEYDFIAREEQMLLSGYTAQDKSQTFFLDLLAYQTPQTSTIVDVLPSTTRFFFNLNVDPFSDFYTQYQEFLDEHQCLKQRDSLLENISEGLSALTKETFSNSISHELSYFKFLDGYGKIRTAVAFQYDDLSETQTQLERLLNYSPPERTISSIDKIHRLYLPNLLSNSLLGFFPKSSTYYFSMIGHHIFFATEEETLLHIRMFFDQQKVLAKTIRLHNFSAQMQDESNLNIYVQDLRTIFRKAPNVACGLQFSGSNGMMYAHAYLQSNAGREREYDQLEIAPKKATPADKIKKAFKGNVVKGAFSVKNHRVKDEPFYLLQDDNFVVYYLDKNAKILWKRKVDGIIKSSVEEVDYLKNQKIQYKFQTEKSTYILDIYGRNVEDYPKKNKR